MLNNKNKMRVIILSHMYPNKTTPDNGVFIHNQIRHIVKAGCDVRVVAPIPYSPRVLWFKPKWKSYGEVPQFDNIDGIPVSYPRYFNLPGTWFRRMSYWSIYLGLSKRTDELIKSFKPQIIHAHTATPSGYVGLMLSRKYRIPLVCSLRGSDINVYPHYDKVTMHCTKQVLLTADRIVSVSKALKSAAEKIVSPRREIKVIYNGCNLKEFTFSLKDRLAYREKINISTQEKAVIFVGELKINKGIFELINVLKNLISNYPLLHAIIVGDGPEHSVIKNEVYSGKLNNKIHLVGNQRHSEVYSWLSAADIFVLPTHYEGLPNAVLEAMACNLPVISTDVGGVPEIIDDGKNGILIRARDEDALSRAIEFLINNEETSKRMGILGREKIEYEFSWERSAQKMIDTYNEVVKR
jgi:teichuronic acid biosynthesis glycosyltransferase TuaC